MGTSGPQQVTRLLVSWSSGNKSALDQLVPLVYKELHRLASGYLRRERSGHTLRTTDLVHEAYLRLIEQTHVESHNRAHFFAIASNLMRQVLVDHAVRRGAAKRGGGNKVTLEDAVALGGLPQIDILALDLALNRLARLDPRQSRIVEMRFFGGLNLDEIADVLEVSASTVKREWRTAKAVLHNELRHGGLE